MDKTTTKATTITAISPPDSPSLVEILVGPGPFERKTEEVTVNNSYDCKQIRNTFSTFENARKEDSKHGLNVLTNELISDFQIFPPF